VWRTLRLRHPTCMDDQQGGFPLGNWQLDPYHTQVEFSARHLGMMRVRGHFAEVSATADIDPDHPEASSVEVTVQAASVRTDNETRDNDLRSSNFLEVDTHPTMTFKAHAPSRRELTATARPVTSRSRALPIR